MLGGLAEEHPDVRRPSPNGLPSMWAQSNYYRVLEIAPLLKLWAYFRLQQNPVSTTAEETMEQWRLFFVQPCKFKFHKCRKIKRWNVSGGRQNQFLFELVKWISVKRAPLSGELHLNTVQHCLPDDSIDHISCILLQCHVAGPVSAGSP